MKDNLRRCGNVIFSVVSICSQWGGGTTHDAFGHHCLKPLNMGPHCTGPPPRHGTSIYSPPPDMEPHCTAPPVHGTPLCPHSDVGPYCTDPPPQIWNLTVQPQPPVLAPWANILWLRSEAGGTDPTGMLSCCQCVTLNYLILGNSIGSLPLI